MKKILTVTLALALGVAGIAHASGKAIRFASQNETLITSSAGLVDRLVVDSVASSSATVTLKLFDVASVAATQTAQPIMTITLPVTATAQTTIFGNIPLGIVLRNGLVVSVPTSNTITASTVIAPVR